MHEYGIVRALIDTVETHARTLGAARVTRLHVSLGEISGVEIDLLASAFEMFREKTVCDGAALEIHPVKAAWGCPSCGTNVTRGEILRCAGCGLPARLQQGDEIVLERIEMEVSDVPDVRVR